MKRENDAGWLALSMNLPGRDRNQVIKKGFSLGAWSPGFLKFSGPWSRLAITKGEYRALYGFIVLALATDGFCRAVGQWPLQGGLEL